MKEVEENLAKLVDYEERGKTYNLVISEQWMNKPKSLQYKLFADILRGSNMKWNGGWVMDYLKNWEVCLFWLTAFLR